MTRTLLVLRHAKSSWDRADLADFNRPLAPRGERAAPLLGRYLRRYSLRPELVLCSAAMRTRQTWALVAAELGGEIACRLLRSLYLAPPSRLHNIVQRAPGAARCLMVIGHNPGLAGFANALCGTGDARAQRRMAAKFPTGALAVIRLDLAQWAELEAGRGRLDAFVRPKDLA
jgi:phosphohistidine phosphatase